MSQRFRVASASQLSGTPRFEFDNGETNANKETPDSTITQTPSIWAGKHSKIDSDHDSTLPSSVRDLNHKRKLTNLRHSAAPDSTGSQSNHQLSNLSHNPEKSVQLEDIFTPSTEVRRAAEGEALPENIPPLARSEDSEIQPEVGEPLQRCYAYAAEEYAPLSIPSTDHAQSISTSSGGDWVSEPVIPSPAASEDRSHRSDSTEDTGECIQGTVTPYLHLDSLQVQFTQHIVTDRGVMQPLDAENLNAPIDPLLVQMAPRLRSNGSEESLNKVDGLGSSLAEIVNRHIESITPEAVAVWEQSAKDFDGQIDILMKSPFLDLCITDNNIGGHAVMMRSEDFKTPVASARIGGNTFLNLPNRSGSNSVNQMIRTNVNEEGRPEFLLTFWGKLFTGSFGETNLGWAASIDLTRAITEVALRCEAMETKAGSMSGSSDDEFGDDLWDPYLARLLLFIYVLRTYHASVLVLGPSTAHRPQPEELMPDFGEPTSNVPRQFQLKYMSAAVYFSGEDIVTNIANMTCAGRAKMGVQLYRHEKHRMHIVWGKQAEKKILYCVPVTDGRYDREQREPWWICFLVSNKAINVW